MSGRFGDALATRVMVGVVVKPCGMLKVVVEPSPVSVFVRRSFLGVFYGQAGLKRQLHGSILLV